MTDKYWHRQDAPFGEGIWTKIDDTVVGAAKARLTGRRLLALDGPHGPALKVFGNAEMKAADSVSETVMLRVPNMTPVPGIESRFSLPIQDLEAFENPLQLPDLGPAARAAGACAAQEDELVFNGVKSLGLNGLTNAKGVQSCKLSSWKEPGSAVENILEGVNKLDSAGFHGPYALALAPTLYYALFKRNPHGDQTELELLQLAVTDGIIKTPALGHGGVLVTAVKELASIVVGQDLTTAFVGPSGRDYEFVVFETAALRLAEPASVCVLK